MKEIQPSKGSACTIVEAQKICSVLEHVKNDDTLVIFDIDNTLVHTAQDLGSDAWAYWMVEQKLRQGMQVQDAIEYIFDLFNHVHEHIDVFPVEDQSVSVVHQLKELSIPTICLTSRPGSMIDRTQEQLKKVGFVLNCPVGLNKAVTLHMNSRVEMANGIICGGINDKGDVLSSIFDKLDYQSPNTVVFIDDKSSCVESIGKACSKGGIGYTGIRYGYLDQVAAAFDAKRADEQLSALLSQHAFMR